MRGRILIAVAVAALAGTVSALAAPARGIAGYDLPAAGVLLEGIGFDERSGAIYVSGVNDGGQIYRGYVSHEDLEVWQPGGVDGRTTARGIDVDGHGRVFVAGGPTGRVWVFSRDGATLASLATDTGAFLNDVWVAHDGAAYVTDSNQPRIFRVSRAADGSWEAVLWLDASATIDVVVGPGQFNLGGIVATRNGRYLLVAQGNLGRLWRVDLKTKEVVRVDLGGVSLVNADGIVLRGHTLWVVQNFTRQISRLALSGDFASGRLVGVTATPSDRTFTTAKLARGRLLLVDSQFGLPQPWEAEDRVVAMRLP